MNNMQIDPDLANQLITQDENNQVQILEKFESKEDRPITPNPYYHHQKRKLLLIYKKQLVEKDAKEEMLQAEMRMRLL